MNRLPMLSRVISGTLGAYAVTVLATIVLSRLLIMAGSDPVEATLGATLASFAVFAGISIAVFHASRPARAWLWLTLTAVPLALAAVCLPVN